MTFPGRKTLLLPVQSRHRHRLRCARIVERVPSAYPPAAPSARHIFSAAGAAPATAHGGWSSTPPPWRAALTMRHKVYTADRPTHPPRRSTRPPRRRHLCSAEPHTCTACAWPSGRWRSRRAKRHSSRPGAATDIGYDVRASSSECHAQIHRIQRLAARERPPTAGHFSPRATCRTRPGQARAQLWAYAQLVWASFARDTTHARSAGEKRGGIGGA